MYQDAWPSRTLAWKPNGVMSRRMVAALPSVTDVPA